MHTSASKKIIHKISSPALLHQNKTRLNMPPWLYLMKNKIRGCPGDVHKVSRGCLSMPRGLIGMYNNEDISIKKHHLIHILYSFIASKKLRLNL
jgi:hypothetical protein